VDGGIHAVVIIAHVILVSPANNKKNSQNNKKHL